MPILLSDILSIIALIVAIGFPIGSYLLTIRDGMNNIENRLKDIKDNPLLVASKQMTIKFWIDILSRFEQSASQNNPLSEEIIRKRRELTTKLENKTITIDEAKELHKILNQELEEAKARGDALAALAIILLTGMVLTIIAATSGK